MLGDISISAITPIDIKKLRKYLKDERGIKNQTMNRYLNDLRAVMNFAKENGYIDKFCPIKALPEEDAREGIVLNQNDIERLLESMRQTNNEYLIDPFLFALSTGLRKSNVVNLQKKHLTKGEDGLYEIEYNKSEMKDKTRGFHLYCNRKESRNSSTNSDVRSCSKITEKITMCD